MAGEGVSFRSFVSETELEEKRKQRQEEWEKVRTADQPLECPEEEVDPRSLYDKLQEQKDKKQTEYEEQFKFKNMVRGIDEDESKFLEEVADRQIEVETRRWREEKDMLEEMKQYTERAVPIGETGEKPVNKAQHTEKTTMAKSTSSSGKRTQASLLAGAVKRKRSDAEDDDGEKRTKTALPSSSSASSQNGPDGHEITPSKASTASASSAPASSTRTAASEATDRPLVDAGDKARVVSVLPGLGFYSNSSDSDTSSSDSEVDLLNSVIQRPAKKKGRAS